MNYTRFVYLFSVNESVVPNCVLYQLICWGMLKNTWVTGDGIMVGYDKGILERLSLSQAGS